MHGQSIRYIFSILYMGSKDDMFSKALPIPKWGHDCIGEKHVFNHIRVGVLEIGFIK